VEIWIFAQITKMVKIHKKPSKTKYFTKIYALSRFLPFLTKKDPFYLLPWQTPRDDEKRPFYLLPWQTQGMTKTGNLLPDTNLRNIKLTTCYQKKTIFLPYLPLRDNKDYPKPYAILTLRTPAVT